MLKAFLYFCGTDIKHRNLKNDIEIIFKCY